MKKTLKIQTGNLMYVPKDIQSIIGNDCEALLNFKSIVVFKKGTDLHTVAESLAVILSDIKLRISDVDD